jgi:hypothetical protein
MVTAVNPDQEALIAQIKILADYVKVNNINRLLLEKGQFFEYGVQCKLGTDDPKLWLEDLKSGGGQEIR